MKIQGKKVFSLLFVLLFINLCNWCFSQNEITSPEDFFGFQMGADYKLARWDKMVDYFYTLEKQSDRIKVMDLGPSSEGHPFLLLLITSPQNLSNLDRLQYINKKISNPRGVSDDSLKMFIKAVFK